MVTRWKKGINSLRKCYNGYIKPLILTLRTNTVQNNATIHLGGSFQKILSIYFCFISFFSLFLFPFSLGQIFSPFSVEHRASAGTSFHQVINNLGTITKSIYESKGKVVYHERATFCFHGNMEPKANAI